MRIYETENQGDYIFSIERGTRKIKPVELTKSMNEKIKANLELLNKAGNLLRMNGEYGTIIASKEHMFYE